MKNFHLNKPLQEKRAPNRLLCTSLFIAAIAINNTILAKTESSAVNANVSALSALPNNINLQSSCGVTVERKDVACSAEQFKVEYERSRPVARIVVSHQSLFAYNHYQS